MKRVFLVFLSLVLLLGLVACGNNNNDIYTTSFKAKIIESMIREEFNLLGFHITLHIKTCECVFDCLCNRNDYKVILTWYL